MLQILNDFNIVVGKVASLAVHRPLQPVLVDPLSQHDGIPLSERQLCVVLSIKVIQRSGMWSQIMLSSSRGFRRRGRWHVWSAIVVGVVMFVVLVTHGAHWREGDGGKFMLWS